MIKKLGLLLACAAAFQLQSAPLNLKDGSSQGDLSIQGDTLTMRKNAQLVYENFQLSNAAGKISFDIRFDFDPAEVSANFKGNPLTGQSVINFFRKDNLHLNVYFIFDTVPRMCIGVFDSANKTYQYADHHFTFKKDEFYHVEIEYGDSMTTTINGQTTSKPNDVEHLFGNVEEQPMKLVIGAPRESRFTLKNIDIEERKATPGRISIPTVSLSAPVIDGDITEEFWDNCACISGFASCFTTKNVAAEQPVIKIAQANDGIYIAGVIPALAGSVPRASTTKRDGQIYLDDAVEMRFQRKIGEKYQLFMVNCNGFIYDSLEKPRVYVAESTLFNPEWKQATKIDGSTWQFEAFIPNEAIGGKPAPGEVWKGNICIDRAGNMGTGIAIFPGQNFNDDYNFGEYLFTGNNQAAGIEKFTTGNASQPVVTITKPGDKQPVVFTKVRLFNPKGTKIDTFEFRYNDTNTALYQAPELEPGSYQLEIVSEDANKTLLQKRLLNCKVAPSVSADVTHYAYAENAVAKLRVGKGAIKGATSATVLLQDEQGKTIQEKSAKLQDKLSFDFSTKKLSAGNYTVLFQVKDAAGKVLDSTSRSLKLMHKPAWFDNQIGIDHTVPVPWTPVKGDRKALSVWNRTFQFNNKIFPQQILNGKVNLFNAIPQISLKIGGNIVKLNDLDITSEKRFDDEIIFTAVKKIQDYTLKMNFKLEFDGCSKCDITVIPPKDGGSIEAFDMLYNYNQNWTGFLLTGDGSGMSSIPVTTNAINKYFCPYNWLGNENGGLAIFFESEQYWTPSNKNAISIVKNTDGSVSEKYNVINAPIAIAKPVTITFGIMPTPVRPSESNNPFAHPKYDRGPDQYSYGETLSYKLPKELQQAGQLTFLMRREKSLNYNFTRFVEFIPDGPQAPLVFVVFNNGDTYLQAHTTNVVNAKTTETFENFTEVTVKWNNSNLQLLFNGKEVINHTLTGERAQLLANVLENGKIAIGGCHPYYSNFVDVIADEVKISALDSDKPVIYDSLDDTFIPDGFSTLTAGGGIPSSGSRFVPGAKGNGIALISDKITTDAERRKNFYKNEIEIVWKWHTNEPTPTGEYQWPPDYFHPLNPRIDKIAKEAHRDNYKFIAYCIYPAIHYPSALADQFRSEWQIEPVNMMPYAPPAGHNMLSTSMAAKGWADYLIAGLEDAFKMYGFNGMYTDGGCSIAASTNAAHGAGWTDANGNRRPSWPFFAARNNFKRIYKFIKKDNPSNIIVNHISFSLPIMTASFSDIIYSGEHENYYDMNTARLRFNSKPWGPQIILLGSSAHGFSALHDMTSLLVGSSVWPHSITGRKDMARIHQRLEKVYNDFGVEDAEFTPFYKSPLQLPEKMYACCYKRPGKCLMLIANYNKTTQTPTITLPCTVKSVKSALTQAPIKHTDKTITPTILPENYQVLELTIEK